MVLRLKPLLQYARCSSRRQFGSVSAQSLLVLPSCTAPSTNKIRLSQRKQHQLHTLNTRQLTTISNISPAPTRNYDNCSPHYDVDFFGEPITFLSPTPYLKGNKIYKEQYNVGDSILALNDFTLTYLTRGKSARGGGDEHGGATQAAHSTAIIWSSLIRNAFAWCRPTEVVSENDHHSDGGREVICEAPMLAVTLICPILAQAGVAYLHHIDKSIAESIGNDATNTSSSSPDHHNQRMSLLSIAKAAASLRDCQQISRREKLHLQVLSCLLDRDHQRALIILQKLLQECPGDAFALSLAMDIASTMGDQKAAFRSATSVAAYWNERSKTVGLHSKVTGRDLGSALIATGFAIGGRYREAEQLAERAIQRDKSATSGIASLALAHVYDAEGRASEGMSQLTGFDGAEMYNECGLLFFRELLGLYGCRFALDRDGASADQVAKRMYDENMTRVLEYSGYCTGNDEAIVFKRAPEHSSALRSMGNAATSIFGNLFSSGKESTDSETSSNEDDSLEEEDIIAKPIVIEDILSWMPPTSQLLVEATLLLLRMTLSGNIEVTDERWHNLRLAWNKVVDIERTSISDLGLEETGTNDNNMFLFTYSPLSRIAFTIATGQLLPDWKEESTVSSSMEKASHLLSQQMQLGSEKLTGDEENTTKWREIIGYLSDTKVGYSGFSEDLAKSEHIQVQSLVQDFHGMNINYHNILEHMICYAALKSEDREMLNFARSVCSESAALKTNSPEMWWRYSLVLDGLGDYAAAEDARAASIGLGSGEGGNLTAM